MILLHEKCQAVKISKNKFPMQKLIAFNHFMELYSNTYFILFGDGVSIIILELNVWYEESSSMEFYK